MRIVDCLAISAILLLAASVVKENYSKYFYKPFRAGQCIKMKGLDLWETEIYLISEVGKHSYFLSECDEWGCRSPKKSIVLSDTNKYEELECPDYTRNQ